MRLAVLIPVRTVSLFTVQCIFILAIYMWRNFSVVFSYCYCWACQWGGCHLLTIRRGRQIKQPSSKCFPLTMFSSTTEPTCLVMKLEEWQALQHAASFYSRDQGEVLRSGVPCPAPVASPVSSALQSLAVCLVSFVSNSG